MDHISTAVILGHALTLAGAMVCVAWGILRWNRTGQPEVPEQTVEQWASEEDQESGTV